MAETKLVKRVVDGSLEFIVVLCFIDFSSLDFQEFIPFLEVSAGQKGISFELRRKLTEDFSSDFWLSINRLGIHRECENQSQRNEEDFFHGYDH